MSNEEYRERVKNEKRTAALDAAMREFLVHGYECTTLQMVAKSAGISSGTLFKYFPTKDALFTGLMEKIWALEPCKNDPSAYRGSPESGLNCIGRSYAKRLRDPNMEALYRLIIAEAIAFPDIAKALYERGLQHYCVKLNTFLSGEIALGTLAVPDVTLATKQYFGMIGAVIFWPKMLNPDLVVTDAEVDAAIREATATLLARYTVSKK